jgi:hypothetical protein
LRDASRQKSELGTGALRRTPPGDAAAKGAVRANGSGMDARGERSEPRWRDIQWVDFTSELDSSIDPNATLSAPLAPEPIMYEPEPLYVAPELPFSQSAPVEPASDEIFGLAERDGRLQVPKLTPVQQRPSAAQTKPPIQALGRPQSKTANSVHAPVATAASIIVSPRPLDLAVVPPSLPPPLFDITARDAAGERLNGDRPFPASIMVPVSAGLVLSEPESRDSPWLLVTSGVATAANVLRAAAVGAMTSGVAVARAAPRRLLPARRAAAPDKPLRGKTAVATRLSAVTDRVSGYVVARENRLRVSGIAALVVITVALVAYGGGTLLARVAEPSATSASTNKVVAAVPKPLAANQVPHPAPVAPAPSTTPPNDPAARAAFYIAHAKTGDPAAQYDLGLLYAQGQGLVQDYASAASWFRAAATQGNVAAEYNLGVLYERGLGVRANPTEAVNWYRAAADQNHTGAQFNLALAYANGSGTSQDFAAAARWYGRAAHQGLAAAMVNLAILYEAGNGVERSAVHAYAWYKVAGERGDDGARARAAELDQQFDDKDKARAEGLAVTIGEALDAAKSSPPPA